jgi:hypothetical protein
VFADWCAARGAPAIPATPAAVAAFLDAEAGRGFGPVTIGRYAAAGSLTHDVGDGGEGVE